MNNPTNPRKENFCFFLKLTCCPSFTFLSFIFFICLFDLAYFILELVMSRQIYGDFLQPDYEALMKLGAKYPFDMKKGHVWLFITPAFMHANFMHIFSNIIATLIFGMSFESAVGLFKTLSIYILSGIGGNLFSALLSDDLSVGASTCIMGLLGGHLAFLILNWDALRPLGFLRCQLLVIVIMIIVMNLFMGLGSPSLIDNFGHFGGFLVGIFSSFTILKPLQVSGWEQRLKKINFVLLACYFIIGFSLFYTVRYPAEIIILIPQGNQTSNQ